MVLEELFAFCEPFDRVVCVKSLPDSTKPEDVISYFSNYGVLTEVLMPPKMHSALLTFESSEAVRSVMGQEHKINGMKIMVSNVIANGPFDHVNRDAKTINLRSVMPQTQTEVNAPTEVSKSLFVRKLPNDTTIEDLRRCFSKYGPLTDIFVPKPSGNFAFVTFKATCDSRCALLEKYEHTINGCPIEISEALSEPGTSPERGEIIDSTTENEAIAETQDESEPAESITGMRDTLRLIKWLEQARGHETSMVSLYLNNGDSLPTDYSVDLLIARLEREYERTTKFDNQMTANRMATHESIGTIKNRVRSNGRTSKRGIVIFCGTIITGACKTEQVLIEFEPYTLVSEKTFCYFDNKFHMGPLAFKLLHFQVGDGLRASDFKKVSEAMNEDLEGKLASFSIDVADNQGPDRSRLVSFFRKDSFQFDLTEGIRSSAQATRAEIAKSDSVIYVPPGHSNLKSFEELILNQDLLVPLVLDPMNAPQDDTICAEKREILIRLIAELDGKQTTPAQLTRASTEWPIAMTIRRVAKKARKIVSRIFGSNRSSAKCVAGQSKISE